jgi:hypothetical protein
MCNITSSKIQVQKVIGMKCTKTFNRYFDKNKCSKEYKTFGVRRTKTEKWMGWEMKLG